MATIHRTTMAPTKLELLTAWLPQRPWYVGDGRPTLSRAGGFRLDDPAGEVGIEFLFVTDGDGTTYHVPATYRGAPLPGAEQGLIGTSEHGVLGTRWIHDAAHDPVAVAVLLDFLQGETEAQHQNESDTPDPSVGRSGPSGLRFTVPSRLAVTDTERGTTAVGIDVDPQPSSGADALVLEFVRVLSPGADTGLGHVEADWTKDDGGSARGPVAVVR